MIIHGDPETTRLVGPSKGPVKKTNITKLWPTSKSSNLWFAHLERRSETPQLIGTATRLGFMDGNCETRVTGERTPWNWSYNWNSGSSEVNITNDFTDLSSISTMTRGCDGHGLEFYGTLHIKITAVHGCSSAFRWKILWCWPIPLLMIPSGSFQSMENQRTQCGSNLHYIRWWFPKWRDTPKSPILNHFNVIFP